jgi:hypothetical protein
VHVVLSVHLMHEVMVVSHGEHLLAESTKYPRSHVVHVPLSVHMLQLFMDIEQSWHTLDVKR